MSCLVDEACECFNGSGMGCAKSVIRSVLPSDAFNISPQPPSFFISCEGTELPPQNDGPMAKEAVDGDTVHIPSIMSKDGGDEGSGVPRCCIGDSVPQIPGL